MLDQPVKPKRRLTLGGAIAILAAISVVFYYRQNFAGQIGGRMSLAKLLWLDYALIAWLILPFFLWWSPRLMPALRWIYGIHGINFAVRGVIELWMLYVTIAWFPPYGITHDLFTIALITALLWFRREELRSLQDRTNRAALRFLTSIRLGLCCEIVFAWLFYRATGGEVGIYFASSDPVFSWINALTWGAVVLFYLDLLRMFRSCREALFPLRTPGPSEKCHA